MSDYRAIAAVTGSLQQFLMGPLARAVPGATVRTGPPSPSLLTASAAAVNIFLYQVNPNPTWRNAELPVRRSDGSLERRPQIALDLDYLISCYGPESKLVPQLLLGAAMSALHAYPRLDPDDIPTSLDGISLEDCGLREQAEVVQFFPIALSHEELARIWQVFFQVPYTLSAAYRCKVVLMEAELNPEPPLPVLATRLHAPPWEPARLERVEPQQVEFREGATVVVEGYGLAGTGTTVRIGDAQTKPVSATEETIEFSLPADVRAGLNEVRLSFQGESSTASATGPPATNPLSLVVLPRITGTPSLLPGRDAESPSALEISLVPPVAPEQTVELALNEWPAPEGRAARSHVVRARQADSTPGTQHFRLEGVQPGGYLVRVEVDGVASRLATDDDATSEAYGRFTGPTVEIP